MAPFTIWVGRQEKCTILRHDTERDFTRRSRICVDGRLV